MKSIFSLSEHPWLFDDTGRATALQLTYQGFQFPLARKVDEESPT